MSRGRKLNPLQQNKRKQIDPEVLNKERYKAAVKILPSANREQLERYHLEHPQIIQYQASLLQKRPSLASKNRWLIISLDENTYLDLVQDDKTPATVLRSIVDYTREHKVATSAVFHSKTNQNIRLHILKRWHQSATKPRNWDCWEYAISCKDATDQTMKQAVKFSALLHYHQKDDLKKDPDLAKRQDKLLRTVIANPTTSFQTIEKIINTSHTMPREKWFEIAELINLQVDLPTRVREKAMKRYR